MNARAPGFLSARPRRLWVEIGAAPGDPLEVRPIATGPGARWLNRVAPVGAPPYRGTVLRMHGEIKLGRWQPFTAEQVISPTGFLWAARAGRFLVSIRGHDLFWTGGGELDWRLFGVFPVMRRSDEDVWRSAAGRHAAELLVFAPWFGRSTHVTWAEGPDGRAQATVALGRFVHRISMNIDADGRLLDLAFPRWGDPGDGVFREERFGVVFESEIRLEDHVLPGSFSAGWWPGTDRWAEGEFFRCVIDDAEFF